MPLPALPYNRAIMRPVVQTVFGGLNHNPGAKDGELYDMENLTGRDYPLLATRPPRTKMDVMDREPSVCVFRSGRSNQPVYVWAMDDEDGQAAHISFHGAEWRSPLSGLSLSPGRKHFAVMGDRIIVMPDAVMITMVGSSYPCFADGSALGVLWKESKNDPPDRYRALFQDGELYGVPATANAIYTDNVLPKDDFRAFHPGDGIKISIPIELNNVYVKQGLREVSRNNQSVVVREVPNHDTTGQHPYYPFLLCAENSFDVEYYAVERATAATGLVAGESYWFERKRYPEATPVVSHKYNFTVPRGLDVSTVTGLYVLGGEGENERHIYFKVRDVVMDDDVELRAGDGNLPPEKELEFIACETTITRDVPALEGMFVHENRLWGFVGNTIYASKLGDPTNFGVYDGSATDSWTLEAQVSGRFTACGVYQGYPTFFTETDVYRIYGDLPSNYSFRHAAHKGVREDSPDSVAEAGGVLFWLSLWGVVAWRGGDEPTVISDPLGVGTVFMEGCAGSSGDRYHIAMEAGGVRSIYVYDARRGMWHREDGASATGFVSDGDDVLWTAPSGGKWAVWSSQDSTGLAGVGGSWPKSAEVRFDWTAQFADSTRFYETSDTASQNKKGLLRVLIRGELASGASMTVWVRYDGGDFTAKRTISAPDAATEKLSYHIPLILRRCDHYTLKLTGTGGAKIYSITAEKYAGSWKQTK